jgi:hypothetical protein
MMSLLLDLEHGLIGMGGIWIQPLAPAVHVEIHFLQDSLADDYFVTQDEGFLVGTPTLYVDQYRLGHIDLFTATISVLGYLLHWTGEAQLLGDEGGDYQGHGARIDERIGLEDTNLMRTHEISSDEPEIDGVRELHRRAYFSHGRPPGDDAFER